MREIESGDLAVHEDSSQIELHLETDVDVGSVDRGRPPESESSIGNLVQSGSLSIGQLLVLHRLLKARCLLPKESFPSWEESSLEECVLKDALNSSKRLDHIGSIVVQVPELSVVPLMSPPEGIDLQDLI